MVEAHWRKASASRFGAAGEEPELHDAPSRAGLDRDPSRSVGHSDVAHGAVGGGALGQHVPGGGALRGFVHEA